MESKLYSKPVDEASRDREIVKQKAAAYDAANKRAEMGRYARQAVEQVAPSLYASGKQQGAEELNALMQEGLAMEMARRGMYDAPNIPQGYAQAPREQMYQNQVEQYGKTPEDMAMESAIQEGWLPSSAPVSQGLAQTMGGRR